jgi:hypothetical protein
MSAAQQRNNRRQGQRIRRNEEKLDAVISGQEKTTEIVSQHDRDIKMLKNRVAELERERSRN